MNKDKVNSVFTFMSFENIDSFKLNNNIFVNHMVNIKDIFSKNMKLIMYDDIENFIVYCKDNKIFNISNYKLLKNDTFGWYEDERISFILENEIEVYDVEITQSGNIFVKKTTNNIYNINNL